MYITHIPIHNVLVEAKKYKTSTVGSQGLEIYPCIKFHLPQCFSLSVTCTYIAMLFKIIYMAETAFCGRNT